MRLMRPLQMEERPASVLEDPAEHGRQRAIDEIVIVSRDKHIFTSGGLHSPMDVRFRADILLIAAIVQILVRRLPLLDDASRLICRSIVRNEDFH